MRPPIFIYLSAIALAAVAWTGCSRPEPATPTPPSVTAAPTPTPANALVAAKRAADESAAEPDAPPPPDPEAAPRRERAGIEGGPAPAREPAPRIARMKEVFAAPPLLEGDDARRARDVLIAVAAWRAEREKAEGARITLMGLTVRVSPPPAPTATVRFHQQVEGEGGCVQGRRELNLALQESDDPQADENKETWTIAVDEVSGAAPCRDARPAVVAGTHEALRLAWDTKNERELRGAISGAVGVRDVGVTVAEPERDVIIGGEGRWILAALGKAEAQRHNTTAFGSIGVVEAGGMRFVYQESGGFWALRAVDRGVPPRGLMGGRR